MGTGWIRWDSLLLKKLLHSTVLEEVALSGRITLGKKKKLFAWSQTVQLQGQKLCQCRAKSSLGLNNKEKNGICQQGVKTKLSESEKWWQGRGRKDKKHKMRLMYAKSTPDKTAALLKLLGEKWLDLIFFSLADKWKQWSHMGCVTIPKSSSSLLPGVVTLVNVIYIHLCFILWCTYVGRTTACVVLLRWFMVTNFHKEIMEVVWWQRENNSKTTALLSSVHRCLCRSLIGPNTNNTHTHTQTHEHGFC